MDLTPAQKSQKGTNPNTPPILQLGTLTFCLFVVVFITHMCNCSHAWFYNYCSNTLVSQLMLCSSPAPCCTQNTASGGWQNKTKTYIQQVEFQRCSFKQPQLKKKKKERKKEERKKERNCRMKLDYLRDSMVYVIISKDQCLFCKITSSCFSCLFPIIHNGTHLDRNCCQQWSETTVTVFSN